MRNNHMFRVIAEGIVQSNVSAPTGTELGEWEYLINDIAQSLAIERTDAIQDCEDIVTQHYVVSTDPDYSTKYDHGYGACAHSIRKKLGELKQTGGKLT
jgi:hypothetical protein